MRSSTSRSRGRQLGKGVVRVSGRGGQERGDPTAMVGPKHRPHRPQRPEPPWRSRPARGLEQVTTARHGSRHTPTRCHPDIVKTSTPVLGAAIQHVPDDGDPLISLSCRSSTRMSGGAASDARWLPPGGCLRDHGDAVDGCEQGTETAADHRMTVRQYHCHIAGVIVTPCVDRPLVRHTTGSGGQRSVR